MIFSRFAVPKLVQSPIILNRFDTRRLYSSTSIQPAEDLDPDKADEPQTLSNEPTEQPDIKAKPRYMSRGKLLAAHKARVVPDLKEEDLEETFVRGEFSLPLFAISNT